MENQYFENTAHLSEDFAEKLLELEIRIEKECEIEIIKSLVGLYSVFLI